MTGAKHQWVAFHGSEIPCPKTAVAVPVMRDVAGDEEVSYPVMVASLALRLVGSSGGCS
jgi:hypothetical protein